MSDAVLPMLLAMSKLRFLTVTAASFLMKHCIRYRKLQFLLGTVSVDTEYFVGRSFCTLAILSL